MTELTVVRAHPRKRTRGVRRHLRVVASTLPPPVVRIARRGSPIRKDYEKANGREHAYNVRAWYRPSIDTIFINEYEDANPDRIARTLTHENLHRVLRVLNEDDASYAVDSRRSAMGDYPTPSGLYHYDIRKGRYNWHDVVSVLEKRKARKNLRIRVPYTQPLSPAVFEP